MEYKNIKCLGCKTQEAPLFLRSPARHTEDLFCKECMNKGKHLEAEK